MLWNIFFVWFACLKIISNVVLEFGDLLNVCMFCLRCGLFTQRSPAIVPFNSLFIRVVFYTVSRPAPKQYWKLFREIATSVMSFSFIYFMVWKKRCSRRICFTLFCKHNQKSVAAGALVSLFAAGAFLLNLFANVGQKNVAAGAFFQFILSIKNSENLKHFWELLKHLRNNIKSCVETVPKRTEAQLRRNAD